MKPLASLLIAAAIFCSSSASGQRNERLDLGRSNTRTISGSIQGKSYADYRVPVGAGQSVTVTLRARSASVYFNFNPPKSDVSMYIGSTSGNKMAARMAPSSGEYIIRVYQMGADADENRRNTFTLTVGVGGTALKPLSSTIDARLRGTPYHATGPVPCSIALEKDRSHCDAFVIRYGGGSATVELRVGQMIRRVLFVKGKPMASDSAEAFSSTRDGDMTKVRFGDDPSEEYTLPDALISGG